MSKKFLFVCGCPRSGTTVLTQLLNWHPRVSIGMERFGMLLYRNSDLFNPTIFAHNRFFDIRKGDCFYDSFEFKAYSDWYCSEFTREKYQKSVYVGDKNPKLYEYLNAVNKNFVQTNFKIIFILRDIYSVAESYNVRANNPDDKWNADNNFKQAIIDWNKAVSEVCNQLQQQDSEDSLITLNYDDFFLNYERGKNKLPILFSSLNLDFSSDIMRGYQLLEKYFQKIIDRKERNQELYKTYTLDKEYIADNALLDKYYLIKEQCI